MWSLVMSIGHMVLVLLTGTIMILPYTLFCKRKKPGVKIRKVGPSIRESKSNRESAMQAVQGIPPLPAELVATPNVLAPMEVVNCEKKECLPRNEKAKKPEIAANKSAQAIQDTPVAAAEKAAGEQVFIAKEAKTQSTERIERTQQTDE